jgi:hypothetical protein
MTSALQSGRRRRQDDVHMALRWSVEVAGQMSGRIKLDAFQRGVIVANMLCEIPEQASPDDVAAS